MYFKLDSVPEGVVLACDRWLRVEDNIAAYADVDEPVALERGAPPPDGFPPSPRS